MRYLRTSVTDMMLVDQGGVSVSEERTVPVRKAKSGNGKKKGEVSVTNVAMMVMVLRVF